MLELSLYNAVLTGMSLDGKAFTYVNQLASSDQDISKRYEWFQCACCPPNVTRNLGFLGGYVWTPTVEKSSLSLNVHLYTAATLQTTVSNTIVRVTQSTDWPWEGKVSFEISFEGEPVEVKIRLRIPGWADHYDVSLIRIFPS
jgi:DUF1680 family protein